MGTDPGPAKKAKAEELKIKIVDEDGLFELIRTRPAKPFDMDCAWWRRRERCIGFETAVRFLLRSAKGQRSQGWVGCGQEGHQRKGREGCRGTVCLLLREFVRSLSTSFLAYPLSDSQAGGDAAAAAASGAASGTAETSGPESELWTVKYAPKSSDKIIGQSGAKSAVQKLKVCVCGDVVEDGMVARRH